MPGPVSARVRAGLGRFVSRLGPTTPLPVAAAASLPLPPPRLRAGGAHFRDDSDFRTSAIAEARMIVAEAGSGHPLTLLDVGCGAGRLAYGLIAIEAPITRYEGVDVMAPPIEWCAQTISPRHPAYRFRTIDVYNERYNPAGSRAVAEAGMPFDDGSFNVAYAYSVFSHMLTADVRAYLHEFARVLGANGVAIVTAFVEDDVPDEVVNPADYQHASWGGALHCVRFSRAHVEGIAGDAGLKIVGFEHGQATDGQSRLILSRIGPQEAVASRLPTSSNSGR